MPHREVKIYGRSDDLIEIDGDIREEFGAYNTAKHVHFNDGTVIKAKYAPEGYGAKWRIEAVRCGNGSSCERREATNEDDDYSDVVTVRGEIRSAACWDHPEGPSRPELLALIGCTEFSVLDFGQLKRICEIINE